MPPKKETKAKKPADKKGVVTRISKWYKADDEPVHFHRKRKTPRPTVLRRNIAPGQVLILLAGRFRGKRVVFLKQLKSGLLLVSGPFKINGVPLKRVNQAYVIPTKTTVDLHNVNVTDVEDVYFARTKAHKLKKSEETFFAASPEVIYIIKRRNLWKNVLLFYFNRKARRKKPRKLKERRKNSRNRALLIKPC